MVEVDAVVGAVVPSEDADAEKVETRRQNYRAHRRTASGLLLPGFA